MAERAGCVAAPEAPSLFFFFTLLRTTQSIESEKATQDTTLKKQINITTI